jgi:hypothetical protein
MFSIEKKKRLAEKIEKITEKKYLLEIRNIIIQNNPTLEITKNNNGLFMKFQSLSDKTYDEIEKLINKINKHRIKISLSEDIPDEKKSSESGDKAIITETLPKRSHDVSKKLRLTNTENQILNRRKYEKELMKNEIEPEIFSPNDIINKKMIESESSRDIFIKKKKTKK